MSTSNSSNHNNILFTPFRLNSLFTLKNRIVMAPMTRNMAQDDLSPIDTAAQYYAKRADAGLIVTEGTIVSPEGRGYSHTPGIYTTAQIEAWKKVTTAVHQHNGLIFLQLWHVGRVSHPDFLNGRLPLSASETSMEGTLSRSNLTYVKSKEASDDDINNVIMQFEKAAINAMLADFDGVEIHGANGYLIDQFLHHHTNLRKDQFGEKAENMARFPLAIIRAVSNAIGAERVGIRLSPGGYLHQIIGDNRDSDNFTYLLKELNKLQLAYVHTGNLDDSTPFPELNNLTMTAFIRANYQGSLIASGNYTPEKASANLINNEFDLISFGRPFIANPDLVLKLQKEEAIIPYHPDMLGILN